ncbi:hypothetical protein AVEN_248000-1 [Araneus ventricosus]|uniref:Uncharacterized protein n=1 Tax=Araneus ventricosus TaxID=182803 RepID=A0A4Y2CPR8_ARAVE|nr:hypothetical protein AVEN_248000-1 [Araneus ventricosus]
MPVNTVKRNVVQLRKSDISKSYIIPSVKDTFGSIVEKASLSRHQFKLRIKVPAYSNSGDELSDITKIGKVILLQTPCRIMRAVGGQF